MANFKNFEVIDTVNVDGTVFILEHQTSGHFRAWANTPNCSNPSLTEPGARLKTSRQAFKNAVAKARAEELHKDNIARAVEAARVRRTA